MKEKERRERSKEGLRGKDTKTKGREYKCKINKSTQKEERKRGKLQAIIDKREGRMEGRRNGEARDEDKGEATNG